MLVFFPIENDAFNMFYLRILNANLTLVSYGAKNARYLNDLLMAKISKQRERTIYKQAMCSTSNVILERINCSKLCLS